MTTNTPSTTTSIKALNHLLAAYTVAAQNARFCHWNVVGPMFEDNHEMFEDLYTFFNDSIDELAERVRALREYPMSSLAAYLQETSLKEYSGEMNAAEMQKATVADLEHICAEMDTFIAETESDVVTQGMIIDGKAELEKKAWMFRAMLGKK